MYADVDALLMLEEACFTTDRVSRRSLLRFLRVPTACCLVAESAGTLAGGVILLMRRTIGLGRIYSLAVSERFRGQGIGRCLMHAAEKEALACQCDRIQLEVRMDNMAAIRLYENLGFEGIRVRAGYYQDGTHAMVYRKSLIDAAEQAATGGE